MCGYGHVKDILAILRPSFKEVDGLQRVSGDAKVAKRNPTAIRPGRLDHTENMQLSEQVCTTRNPGERDAPYLRPNLGVQGSDTLRLGT